MADINVKFIHPTDGREVNVTLDNAMTAREAIDELLQNGFITAHPHGYNLAVKGGDLIRAEQTFAEVGVTDKDTLRVLPATDAGSAIMGS